jgi:hypothetical protein
LVGPDCRFFLDKYSGISKIIRLGRIYSPEEAIAFVERHARVLKELDMIGRITRRIEGSGPNGLLSEAEKTALKDACAAGVEDELPEPRFEPEGPSRGGARAVFRGEAWHLRCLQRGRRRGGPCHGRGCPEAGAADENH